MNVLGADFVNNRRGGRFNLVGMKNYVLEG